MAKATTTTIQQILDAVHDLHNQEQVVTREALQEVTGFKLTVIDDRLGVLVEEGAIVRKGRGVFVPAVQHPPARPISKTILPNGMIKIEIGDVVIDLTPREDRFLASMQAGTAVQFAAIETGHEMLISVGAMRNRISSLEAKLREMAPAAMGDPEL